MATGLPAAAGAWAPHVVETMSSPALGVAGYTGLLRTNGISFKETVKRTANLQSSRDHSLDFSSNIPEDGVFKVIKQGVSRSR